MSDPSTTKLQEGLSTVAWFNGCVAHSNIPFQGFEGVEMPCVEVRTEEQGVRAWVHVFDFDRFDQLYQDF